MRSDVLNQTGFGGGLRRILLSLMGLLFALNLTTPSARAATAPVITTQPVGGTNLTATAITFSVIATGTTPLRYQWFINLTNRLIGATNSTLIYTNLGGFQEGFYTVAITNVAGAVTSNPVFLDMLVPPLVTRQPTNQVAPVGGSVSFRAIATGDPVLRYQWFFNVIDEIIGATNATLVLTNLQLTNSGTYQVEVSNDQDTVNSVEAILLVKRPPAITAQPVNTSVPTGTAAQFSVTVSGDGPINYQWFYNNTNSLFGATNSALTLPDVQLAHTGNYHVRVATDVGSVTSAPAALLVLQAPSITSQPGSASVIAGSNAAFSVAAIGTQPLRYHWFFNRTNSLPENPGPVLSLTNIQPVNGGIYSVVVSNQSGSVTSINASLSVFVPPQLTQSPTNLVIRAGQNAAFAVTATGTAPLAYRWYFNETNLIAGASSSSLTLLNVPLANAGNYSVVVTNFAGAVTSAPALLTVQSAPVIVLQPTDRTVAPGTDATFSVFAIGDSPFAYQWFFNATNAIPGATGGNFTLSNAQSANNGRYSVRITNSLGTTFSVEVILTVKRPPVLEQQPVSLTVTQGVTASFAVFVSGDGPFGYRWIKDGFPATPGTNGPVLLLQDVHSPAAGVYSVIVTNEVGSATSANATLVVRIPPSILVQPSDVSVRPGANATFTVSAAGDQPLSYRWFLNATNALPAATNASLTLPNVQHVEDAFYSVAISNDVGFVLSTQAVLRVRTPPSILVPPASLTSTQGHGARFTVAVTGDGPFGYQWFFNTSTPVAGATNDTLELLNLLPTHAGQYSVRVTNIVGSILSAPANLLIRLLPSITQQPSSLTVTQGQNATLRVVAGSGTPLTYNWRHNGIATSGVQSNFVLNAAQPSDSGAYDVVIANTYGSVTSTVANLTVFGLDFGDAPSPAYPTLLVNNPARHVIVAGVHLGAAIDPDPDGQPTVTATGDDANGLNDDDGVRFPGTWHVGQMATIEIVASTNGFLSGWVDFNHTNAWADSGEHILTNAPVAVGTNLLTIAIPSSARTGDTFARFRFVTASVSLSYTNLALDGEVEDYAVSIVPASDLRLTQSFNATTIPIGNTGVLTITATNLGPSVATSVSLTHELSPRSTFISVASSHGSCAHLGGSVVCDIGSLDPGAELSVIIQVGVGPGTNVSRTTIQSAEFDPSPTSATSIVVGTATLPQFANSEILILPLPDSGGATPYPSSIFVSGATAAVHSLTVTLRGLNHDFPDDIDILLVGPQGQAVVLMSDAGSDNPIPDANITFDDAAAAVIPDTSPTIVSGSYRPANHPPLNETYPAPAPPGPYAESLAAFSGINPNGTWSLYVLDDSLDNGLSPTPGFIADGWTLNITTSELIADLGITAHATPVVASINEPITYTVLVTNFGPNTSAATVQSTLPPGFTFLASSTPQGSCTNMAGSITCVLGDISPDGSVEFSITVTGFIGGPFTNAFSVSGNNLDLNPANNTASALHSILPVVDLDIVTQGPQTPVLLGETTTISLQITNRGPNNASSVWLTNQLPAGATFVSAASSQGSCVANGSVVVCELGALAPGAAASAELRLFPGLAGVNSNHCVVASEELDIVPANNSTSFLFDASPAADLALTTAVLTPVVLLNREFIVVQNISNLGPVSVDAILQNSLPPGVTFLNALTLRGSCTNLGGEIHCAISALAPGENATVTITGRATALGSITNLAAVTGSLPDFNPSNNTSATFATVSANANLALTMSDRPDPVWLNDNLIYTLAITNHGPSAATNIAVTNQLPAGITFLSATSGQGTCTRLGDQVRCDIGALNPGSGVIITITTRPIGTGIINNSAFVTSRVPDEDVSNNIATQVTRVITANTISANSAPITTPLLGLANPFPSTITVSGVPTTIFRLRVSLLNLSHTFSDDLDILLVGPDGRATLLMSDCGGEFSMNNVSLTIDDGGLTGMSDFSSVPSGTYRPSNFGAEMDPFSAPAPAGPYATNLSIFNGTDPNGTWSLYVMDDADKDSGILSGGWRLSIASGDPIADLAVGQTVSTNPAAAGSNVVFTYTVTNLGPATASNVRLTNTLPDTLIASFINNPHGACVVTGNTLICNLGSLTSNSVATMSITGSTPTPGLLTNIVGVASDGTDFHALNNVSILAVIFDLPPVILVQPQSQTAAPGGSVDFIASVIGAPSLGFRWLKDGQEIPGAIGSTLSLSSVSLADLGSYRLRVFNHVGATLSEPAVLRLSGPPVLSVLSDAIIDEDTDTGFIAFTAQDYDTDLGTVTLLGESSDPAVVPNAGISFGGAGQNRTVRVTPAPNASGSAVIAITALDTTGASSTNFFVLQVRPVIDPIVILVQPRNYLSVTGSTVTLSVTATSSLPLSYQWQKDGNPLPEATAATLTFTGLDPTNAGTYIVLISNADTDLSNTGATLQITDQLPSPNIVSISHSTTNATVTFTTVVGLIYHLEYRDDLNTPGWSPLASLPGTGSTESLIDPVATVPHRFYRIRVE